jgi:hypothetical protein
MIKNRLVFILIFLFTISLSFAKEKPVSTKNFKFTNIGKPIIEGTSQNLQDGISLTAGGADVWGTKDQFGFSYFMQNGDFDLVAQIESMTAAHLYSKAGLMAREQLTDNSRHIFFQVFPDNNPRNKNNGGFEFQYREEQGADMKAIYPAKPEGLPEFPVNYPNTWIRLKRVGSEFSGYSSSDGKNWKLYTSFQMNLSRKVYLGLAVTSHQPKETITVVFRNISTKK